MVAARVQALGRGLRAAVALALHQVAVRGVLGHLLGGDVQCGFEHRTLDEVAASAPVALGHRH